MVRVNHPPMPSVAVVEEVRVSRQSRVQLIEALIRKRRGNGLVKRTYRRWR